MCYVALELRVQVQVGDADAKAKAGARANNRDLSKVDEINCLTRRNRHIKDRRGGEPV